MLLCLLHGKTLNTEISAGSFFLCSGVDEQAHGDHPAGHHDATGLLAAETVFIPEIQLVLVAVEGKIASVYLGHNYCHDKPLQSQ